MATTYNVYFGLAGNMSLVSEGQATTDWDIPVGDLDYNTTYEWQIDSLNENGVTYGETWEFTTLAFLTPSDVVTTRRLVVAAANAIFFEDE
ncbi:hypothetical protein [Neptuniibacter sp.]|uniref:hypothetical protein n=1 Tax=Neptuniibacter sp. TaxID=1962643 RepID=UPI00262F3E22|nr:hypothetical protein [Neptuniibacter sp.]MCP4598507.1 hypothetical protein [Neptuniibacter sp.]